MSDFRTMIEFPALKEDDVDAAIDLALTTHAGASARVLSKLKGARLRDRLFEEFAYSPLGVREEEYYFEFYKTKVLGSADKYTPPHAHRVQYGLTLAHALAVFDTVQVRTTEREDINPVQEYALFGAKDGEQNNGWYLVARWTAAEGTLVSESVIQHSVEHLATARACKNAPNGLWKFAAFLALMGSLLFLGGTEYGYAIIGYMANLPASPPTESLNALELVGSILDKLAIGFLLMIVAGIPSFMVLSASLALAGVKARKVRARLIALVDGHERSTAHHEQCQTV